jgi:hypothetical protein
MAAAMRATGADDPNRVKPQVGAQVTLDAGEGAQDQVVNIIGVVPTSGQRRLDPKTGRMFVITGQGAGWRAVGVRDGGGLSGDAPQVLTTELVTAWDLAPTNTVRSPQLSVELASSPGQPFTWPWDMTVEAKAARVAKPWQDEAQVRQIGQAIREHVAQFAGRGTPQRSDDDIREERSLLLSEYMASDTTPARRKAIQRRREQLLNEMWNPRSPRVDAEANELRAVLARVRPGFGTGKFAPPRSRGDGWKMANESARNFPVEWVEASNAAGPATVKTNISRGYYQHFGGRDRRAPERLAAVVAASNQTTATHEWGHRLQYTAHTWEGPGATSENAHRRIDAAAIAFHRRRTQQSGKPTRPLSQIVGAGRGYRSDEIANDDHYFNPYVGREYGGDPREVWTMGVESVFHGIRGGGTLRERDPEHYDLITGILAGVP